MRPDLAAGRSSPFRVGLRMHGDISPLTHMLSYVYIQLTTGKNLLKSYSANITYRWLTSIKYLSFYNVTFSASLTNCTTRTDLDVRMKYYNTIYSIL